MPSPCSRPERARAVLELLPTFGHLLDDIVGCDPDAPSDPMRVRVCVNGGLALAVSRLGGPVELVSTRTDAGWQLRPTEPGWLLDVVCDWLGVSRGALGVDVDRLPARLRARVQPHVMHPLVGWWPLTGLSDSGVPFTVLADCLRVQWGVDLDTVEGSQEWRGVWADTVAAETVPWGGGDLAAVAP